MGELEFAQRGIFDFNTNNNVLHFVYPYITEDTHIYIYGDQYFKCIFQKGLPCNKKCTERLQEKVQNHGWSH